ncbi:NAD-dependent epimerase/dehydratase family protein, partial [bacterium]|nr:NAD-dependent epimerase/dehydratase family protein [candidate division CSSED10-310 bacterium]
MNTAHRTMNQVLVTGATGFIGSHLTRSLLKMGITPRILIRNPEKAAELGLLGAQIVTGDLHDVEKLNDAVSGIDTVFHAAAILGPAHTSLEKYRSVNVTGTENLMDACRQKSDLQRFVHVSSVGVLGPLPSREIAGEGTPPKPVDFYEMTKREGEEVALAAARKGFPAVIARPAWVYGPGDTRTLRLFRMIAKRRFLIIGKASNKQHPVWIGDVVEGLIKCATVTGIEGRVYHLAGPDYMSVEKLCMTVADATGCAIPRFRPPLWSIYFPALLIEKLFRLWGGQPPVDTRKVEF